MMNQLRLSPTSLSQYIRLENCERYLHFRLVPEDVHRFEKKWGLTIQPLTPLLKESGADFEHNIADKLAARGEKIIDLKDADLTATIKCFREVINPTILFQPALESPIGNYQCSGRADVIHLSRDKQNRLKVIIADIKATRNEKTEHRVQVAAYASMINYMANANNLPISEIQGTILTKQDDGNYPTIGAETATFDLDTYISILERLVIADDSVVNRIARQTFEETFYNLNYKCDGCLYNALCMYDSAERVDISITPQISAVEKRVLNDSGITTLYQLATLMEYPQQGQSTMQAAPSHHDILEILNNRWPVGPKLPMLVQRARAALRHIDASVDYRPFLYGSSFGTLPSDEEYPELIKIFIDAQRDYLQDRVYLISALVKGPRGDRVIVSSTDRIPNDELEKTLLIDWIRRVINSMRDVAASDTAYVHLYSYNRYDQKVLLEALKRHLTEVAAVPAFFDLLTQSPALTQPIISFLADEVQERLNSGRVCEPLHDVARWRGFDWNDEQHEYYSLFRARMFDNRRNVIRGEDGNLRSFIKAGDGDQVGKSTIEAASRFNSQIPLEYAYAAWGALPESKEDSRLLEPFRHVDLNALKSFAGMRVKALAHIEGSFKLKTRFLKKQPINLPHLTQVVNPIDLAQSLREFLYMEHHTTLQNNILTYSLPIERRAQSGLAMLLKFIRVGGNSTYQFTPEFGLLGLDPVLAMNACKLKEGDWVVINSTEVAISANQIKHGRLAIIQSINPESIILELLHITFYNGDFRYYHTKGLEPIPGQHYTIDPMSDDLNADKIIEALANTSGNTFFNWLKNKPAIRNYPPDVREFYKKFTDMIDGYLINQKKKLTHRQRELIIDHFNNPLIVMQGPPGTGKSYTLAWAILSRIAAASVRRENCRVLISCKTHNAINVVLKDLAEAQKQVGTFAPVPMGGNILRNLEIYKIVNDHGDFLPPGVNSLRPYEEKARLEPLLQKPYIVFGATSGATYNMMKYRALGGGSIDWTSKSFDLVLIDEASQMSVPEALLAGAFLKPNGSMIVVGDHRQMPPIIAHPWKDEQKRSVSTYRPYLSLFETLVETGFSQVKLDESFRLHEQLAKFLRDNIYTKDGIDFHSRRKEMVPQLPRLNPYVDSIMDPNYPIVVVEHTENASQQFNQIELELASPLIKACVEYLSLDGKNGIGVVVPHRAQKALLRAEFPALAKVNSIDTVERFQGDQRDVIIVSATASDPDYVRSEADFLLSLNRLNVAISRPRKKLIVIASRSVIDLLTSDLQVFENSILWKRLFRHYTPDILFNKTIHGVDIFVRGRRAN